MDFVSLWMFTAKRGLAPNGATLFMLQEATHSLETGRSFRLQVGSVIRRSGTALVCVAAALVSTLFLQPLFPYPFLFLFFAAVMISAWFGGTAPGLFAVLLSTLAVDYFFVPPFHSFAGGRP